MEIILATKSARRIELFKKITDNFQVIPSNVDEKEINEKDPVEFAVKASILKAKDIGEKYPDCIVIGADTVVDLNGEIIGKPENYIEAKENLKKLSGSQHRVITGIAIYNGREDKLMTDYEITYVKFKELSDEEIEKYLERDEYSDKAGGYGIQKIGDKFVEEIKGDYDNVVGLPVKRLKKLIRKFNSPEFTVEIVDIAFPNNWAVGKKDNFVIFVPEGVVGDKIRIRISKEGKSFSYGEIVRIEEKSPLRKQPECEYFGKCGGCALQNIKYEEQLKLKENYLYQTLKKIGGIDTEKIEKIPTVASPSIFYYRNKMEFAFGEEEGKTVIGLRERHSPFKKYRRKVIGLNKCLIFSQIVEKIFPVVEEFAQKTSLPPYNPFTKKGYFRHLIIREGKNTGEIMVILETKSGKTLDFTEFVEKVIDALPEIKSIYWVENDMVCDVVNYEKKHHLYGKSFIEEKLNNIKFRIYPQTFFQPNTKCAEILYSKIVENIEGLKEKPEILGLYCGSGPIEIFVSQFAKKVVGIDSDPVNIKTAFENCQINNIENCSFQEEKVEKLKSWNFKNFNIIILDPPRGGISKKSIKRIVKNRIPFIIYISCNPSTFARDLKEFTSGGYELKKIYSFDFFPHTTHIEGMAVLKI